MFQPRLEHRGAERGDVDYPPPPLLAGLRRHLRHRLGALRQQHLAVSVCCRRRRRRRVLCFAVVVVVVVVGGGGGGGAVAVAVVLVCFRCC